MELNQFNRLFTFGCSFTQYSWPTWADILGTMFPAYYNYGEPASSNQMIFRSIISADLVHKFNNEDLIVIMWTDYCRDEIMKDGVICGTGNVFIENIPDKLEESILSYFRRDMKIIYATYQLLKLKKLNIVMTSMTPMQQTENLFEVSNFNHYENNFYKELLSEIKPSFLEVIFDGKWPEKHIGDPHPSTDLHFEFLKKTFPSLCFTDSTVDYVKNYKNHQKQKQIIL